MIPFYDLALKLFTRTQTAQIQKGIEKYPEPFNPRSWTPGELLNHALEETVDLTHYLVGLKVLLDDRDEEIKQLNHKVKLLEGELSAYRAMENMQVTIASSFPKPNFKSWIVNQEFTEIKKPPYSDLDD